MSASLIFSLGKNVSFAEVLRNTHRSLRQLLRIDSVPPLISELPPRLRTSATTLEGTIIGPDFPGAYVRFQGDDESTVSLNVFEGGGACKELMVGVGTVSTATSQVLGASVAIAIALLMGNVTIGDYGSTWIAQDDSTPEELFNRLALQQPQSDFARAIELAHHKQAYFDRYPVIDS